MGNVMFGRGVVDAAASDGAAVGKGGGGAAGFWMARLEQAPAKGESTMSANKMPSKRSASVGCMVVAARRSGIIQTYMYVRIYVGKSKCVWKVTFVVGVYFLADVFSWLRFGGSCGISAAAV